MVIIYASPLEMQNQSALVLRFLVPAIIIYLEYFIIIIIIWINNLRKKKMEIWRSNEGVLSLIVLNILLFFLIWDNMDCLMINPALFVVEMDVMFLIGFFINLRYVGKNKQISNTPDVKP